MSISHAHTCPNSMTHANIPQHTKTSQHLAREPQSSISLPPPAGHPPATTAINILHCILLLLLSSVSYAQLPGTWEVVLEDAGIASMHTAVTHSGAVVLLDRTDIGPSRLPLPSPSGDDPTAHSALFDPTTRSLRPLSILTDTWCSSGQFLPDGTLLQTGGDMDGLRKLRTFQPCNTTTTLCDWLELPSPLLSAGRWYATNQILPDGSVIIAGGRAAPSVEFYPPNPTLPLRPFPFLAAAADPQLDNLYPFLHLLPDGNLFVFANAAAVLYHPPTGAILRRYPPLPGGPRNYPYAGSSAMLAVGGGAAEILVCGGAKYGAFLHQQTDAPAATSCGRIVATDPDASWAMEEMPFPRVMGDMVMLPTAEILIINGAMAGSQGFGMAFSPEYLSLDRGSLRPEIVAAPEAVGYGEGFDVEVTVVLPVVGVVEVNLASAPFVTHSFSQGQRLVRLETSPPAAAAEEGGDGMHRYRIGCTAPPDGRVAPPGYYMAFAVNQGVPSVAKWVRLVVYK